MQIPHLYPDVFQIIRQALCHFLRERRDESSLSFCCSLVYLTYQMVHLTFCAVHLYHRIQQPCRPYYLLCRNAAALLFFIRRRRCTDVNYLIYEIVEFFKFQRSVVKRRRQSETVIHQRLLPRPVPRIHRPKLRKHDMRFIYYYQKIIRYIVYQRIRPASRFKSRYVPRVVLYAFACADFSEHFHIVSRPLLYTLRFYQLAAVPEPLDALLELFIYRLSSSLYLLLARHIMRCRIYRHVISESYDLARDRIYFLDGLDFISEKLYPDGIFSSCRVYVYRVSSYSEIAALHRDIISRILNIDELSHQLLPVLLHARTQRYHLVFIVYRTSQSVYARYARYYYHVSSFGKRCSCGMPEFFYLCIDVRILFYIRVGRSHVRLRLIVVVVGDEVFHCVLRKKFLELAVQLSCQRLVMGYHERRFLHFLYELRHRKGFP